MRREYHFGVASTLESGGVKAFVVVVVVVDFCLVRFLLWWSFWKMKNTLVWAFLNFICVGNANGKAEQ